jgi:osmotically-inducible protein OsmY
MRKVRSFLFATIAVIGISVIGASAQDYVRTAAASPKPLEQQVYKKLRGLTNYNVFDNITATANGSVVMLEGKVITLGTKRQAENVVKGIQGVTEVVNNIEELPPSPADDRIRRAAYLTFVNRGPAQYFSTINPDVRIIVENGRITLEGYVYRESDSNMLNILANGISGVFEVTNNLVIGKRVS